MKKVIAIDIGGTSIKYGIVSDIGDILFHSETPTNALQGGERLMKTVEGIVETFLAQETNVVGIGISTAGQVCSQKGEVTFANENLPGWTGMKIRENLEKAFSLPAFVENDVNAAALGESWVGAGKGEKDFLCITVGTGVGGAIVINGQVYHGATGSAGEFGHLLIKKGGYLCNCGQRGCFEQYASTGALVRRVQSLYVERGEALEDKINGRWIFEQVALGNAICQEGIEYFVDHLAIGMATLIHIFNPSLIVIGGGVTGQGELLLQQIQKKLDTYIMDSYRDALRIAFAKCGNHAGMLGAAYGLLQRLTEPHF